jgi:hypothetical protein
MPSLCLYSSGKDGRKIEMPFGRPVVAAMWPCGSPGDLRTFQGVWSMCIIDSCTRPIIDDFGHLSIVCPFLG